jgi:hypothetical protein
MDRDRWSREDVIERRLEAASSSVMNRNAHPLYVIPMDPANNRGGGSTRGGEWVMLAHDAKSKTLLAHELGHLLGFHHPEKPEGTIMDTSKGQDDAHPIQLPAKGWKGINVGSLHHRRSAFDDNIQYSLTAADKGGATLPGVGAVRGPGKIPFTPVEKVIGVPLPC